MVFILLVPPFSQKKRSRSYSTDTQFRPNTKKIDGFFSIWFILKIFLLISWKYLESFGYALRLTYWLLSFPKSSSTFFLQILQTISKYQQILVLYHSNIFEILIVNVLFIIWNGIRSTDTFTAFYKFLILRPSMNFTFLLLNVSKVHFSFSPYRFGISLFTFLTMTLSSFLS